MSNSRQVSPDPTDEERDPQLGVNNNNNANNMEPDGAGVAQAQPMAGPMGLGRRDENAISFRHFLQPHSDVVPLPAPTCRSRSRGTQPGAVDLVDMAMALPDFVQDHLVVESLANIAEHQNDGGSAHSGSLDMNVLNEILPDFATSQQAHSHAQQPGTLRRRNAPDESPGVPEATHAAAGSSALPDFLSDGPMQCTDSNIVDNSLPSSSTSSRSTSRLISSASLTERSRMVDESSRGSSFDSSDTLRTEVDRLRRELLDRNRRISQLETEILRLRTSVNSLENAVRVAEQSAVHSEARLMQVQRRNGGDSCDNVATSSRNANDGVSTEINASVVRDIAQSSEALLAQLLENMTRLRLIGVVPNSMRTDETLENTETERDDSTKNLGTGRSALGLISTQYYA